MPIEQTRIFHGGRGGKGAAGFAMPPDRIIDDSGTILVLGDSGALNFKEVFGGTNLIFEGFALFMVDDYIDFSATNDVDVYSQTGDCTIAGVTASIKTTNGNLDIHTDSGRIIMTGLRSGTTQALAGAAANEIWHRTTDHVLMIGI